MRKDNPKFRDDIEVRHRTIEGDDETLLYDPVLNRYHQTDLLQEVILRKLDGRRTLAQVAAETSKEMDVEIPLDVLGEFVTEARRLFLLDVASAAAFSPEEGQRVWKAVDAALDRAGFVLRDAGFNPYAQMLPSRPDLYELFEKSVSRLEGGDPISAARGLYELLELDPKCVRARYLLNVIQTASLKARRPPRNIFSLTFSLGNPDRILTWLSAKIGFLVSPWFYGALCLSFVAGAVLIANNYERLLFDLGQIRVMAKTYPVLAAGSWLCFPFLALGHEFCHGLACKRFGGRVPEIGVLLMMLMFPAAYCDTSATYTFASRYQRIAVSLAGISWQLFWYLPSVLLFLYTDGTSFLHFLALMMILTCWGTCITVVIPFFKNDGYYALSDLFNVPNLYEEAGAFWPRKLKGWLLGLRDDEAEEPKTSKAVALYGIINIFTSFGMMLLTYFAVTVPSMTTVFRGPGLIFASLPLYFLFRGQLTKLVKLFRARWKDILASTRALALGGVLALGLALAAWVPLPTSLTVPFQASIGNLVHLRSGADGYLVDFAVREGDEVRRGQVIAELSRGAAQSELAAAQTSLAFAQADLAKALALAPLEQVKSVREVARATRAIAAHEARRFSRGRELAAKGLLDLPALEAASARLEVARQQNAELDYQLTALTTPLPEVELKALREAVKAREADVALRENALEQTTLRAPFDGRVVWSIVPRAEVLARGTLVKKGDELVRLSAVPTIVTALEVPIEYSDLMKQGLPVKLRLGGAGGAPVEGRLASLDAAEATGTDAIAVAAGLASRLFGEGKALQNTTSLQVKTAPLGAPSLALDGGRGRAKIELLPQTLLQSARRGVIYWFGYYWWSLW